jgi:hypothetical protein
LQYKNKEDMSNYYLFLDDERMPVNRNRETQMSAHDLTGDKRYFLYDWLIVRNFGEFVKTIEEKGIPLVCSFDHDLKDFHYYHYSTYTVYTGKIDYTVVEGTGYECAKWLINYLMDNNLDAPEILTHTQNRVGGKNIRMLFEELEKI